VDIIDAVMAYDVDGVMPRIRQQLEAQGLTHRDLARHLGISTKHLSMLMTGKATPTLPMLFAMLDILDVSMVLIPVRGGGTWTAQPKPDTADEANA
jgi:transcriptional regulator with XRE-family HTH domain